MMIVMTMMAYKAHKLEVIMEGTMMIVMMILQVLKFLQKMLITQKHLAKPNYLILLPEIQLRHQ